MRRQAQDQLLTWYQNPRRKPLILRGARQVGKSTLVRQFAKEQNIDLAEINLERHASLNAIFQTFDTKKILSELEAICGKQLLKKNTLLFLDEIQATPQALAALRYLYEDHPQLAVVAAGSLLEFVLAKHDFSMPVGRIEYLHLGPMTFSEFLLALHETHLLSLLKKFKLTTTLPDTAHQKLLDYQRLYLFVGGMPESILVYSQTQSLTAVQNVHHSILQTYQDDFAKYGKGAQQLTLLQQILLVLPKFIATKVKYSNINHECRAAVVKTALDLLIKSRLLHIAYHSDASGLPLSATQDHNIFKLYFLDCGLFNTLCGTPWQELNALTERELINEGPLAEQFVAQHLAYHHQGKEAPNLHYWLRESKSQNAEVDFLMAQGKTVVPIEVKAGKSGSLKSLQQFVHSKKIKTALRFDLNKPSVQNVKHKLTGTIHNEETVKFTLITLPVYMVEFVGTIF